MVEAGLLKCGVLVRLHASVRNCKRRVASLLKKKFLEDREVDLSRARPGQSVASDVAELQ